MGISYKDDKRKQAQRRHSFPFFSKVLFLVLSLSQPPTSMDTYLKKFSHFLLAAVFFFEIPNLSASESVIFNILKASKAVVKIYARAEGLTKSPEGAKIFKMEREGAGVILDASGIIVTNAHTVQGAQIIAVKTQDGNDYGAKVLGLAEDDDLVFLKIEPASPLNVVSIEDSGEAKLGGVVYSFGNSAFLNQTISEGSITGIGQKPNSAGSGPENAVLRINFKVYPGDSGTPVFSPSGKLMGLTVGGLNSGNQETFAVTAERIKRNYLKLAAQQ